MKMSEAGSNKPTFAELLAKTTAGAVHLEVHDWHLTSDPGYQAWQAGQREIDTTRFRGYIDLISTAVARGVVVRRVRIVSEPTSDYVQWEHALTGPVNIAAGEKVRWLPRRLTSTLGLPGNPYWVFDDRLVRFSLFGGDGEVHGHQFFDDPNVIKLCMSAFETVWELATPHQEFKL